MVWPAAGAGPAKLALADQELDFTRLAPCRRHGAADIYIDNAYGDSPPPHFFGDLERHNERQELSAMFLDVRGRLLANAGLDVLWAEGTCPGGGLNFLSEPGAGHNF
jgi:hypothetical protein